jgi:hypothetical protein
MLKKLFCLFFFLILHFLNAGVCAMPQDSVQGSGQRILMFSGFAGLCVPGMDLKQDYGSYGEIGGAIQYQAKNRLFFSLEYGYLFGSGVKNDPVANLRDEDGQIIGSNGSYAGFQVYQRGFTFPMLKLGYTINLNKKAVWNTLGGLNVSAGGGYFGNWTYIQDISKKTPQFQDQYREGYERYRAGPGFGFWIGYLFLPESGKINFHAEAGYCRFFMETKRYDFLNMEPAGLKKNDSIFQVRLKICFTIRSRPQETFYYY